MLKPTATFATRCEEQGHWNDANGVYTFSCSVSLSLSLSLVYVYHSYRDKYYDSDGVRGARLEHLKKRETDLEEILELERRATEFVELGSSIQKKSTQCLKA